MTRNAAPTADDVLIGFLIGSREVNDYLFVGMVFDGADYAVSRVRFKDGVFESGFFDIASPENNADIFFRFRHLGEGVIHMGYGNSDAAAETMLKGSPNVLAGPTDPAYAGFCAIGLDDTAVSVDYGFDDWYSHEADGAHPTTYHIFRDPGDPGAYDLGAAQNLLDRIGHTHYRGFVIDTTQLLCDNQGGCDREPMGL